eukprot:scaffold2_cov110-Isochrysis_galbana.AAC.3
MATRQGRHKGAGQGTYTSCSDGGGSGAAAFPHPFREREKSCDLAIKYRRSGANWAPPCNSYLLPQPFGSIVDC